MDSDKEKKISKGIQKTSKWGNNVREIALEEIWKNAYDDLYPTSNIPILLGLYYDWFIDSCWLQSKSHENKLHSFMTSKRKPLKQQLMTVARDMMNAEL